MFREFTSDNKHGYYYKCVRSILHPYDNDDRCEEEKFIEEFEKEIFANINSSAAYFNSEKNRFEIPLYQLLMGRDGDDGNFISLSELKYVYYYCKNNQISNNLILINLTFIY